MLHHLYGSLAICLRWPAALQVLLNAAAVLAIDVTEEMRLPCFVAKWSFFTKMQLVAVLPLALTVAAWPPYWYMTWTAHKKKLHAKLMQRHRNTAADADAAAAAARAATALAASKRAAGSGLGIGAMTLLSVLLNILDLVWPTCTRVLLSFWRCRDIDTSQDGELVYLEVDFNIECGDDDYEAWRPFAVGFGVAYSLGFPLILAYVLYCVILPKLRLIKEQKRAEKEKGQDESDYGKTMLVSEEFKTFAGVNGWLHEPYREGCEWWFLAEMVRKLFLTSMISFSAETCAMKIMLALLVSQVFLVAFLWIRPYHSKFLNALQGLAILVPAIATGYALQGLVEREHDDDCADTEADAKDVAGLVALHAAILVPLLGGFLFVVGSAIVLWVKGRRLGKDARALAQRREKTRRRRKKRKGRKASDTGRLRIRRGSITGDNRPSLAGAGEGNDDDDDDASSWDEWSSWSETGHEEHQDEDGVYRTPLAPGPPAAAAARIRSAKSRLKFASHEIIRRRRTIDAMSPTASHSALNLPDAGSGRRTSGRRSSGKHKKKRKSKKNVLSPEEEKRRSMGKRGASYKRLTKMMEEEAHRRGEETTFKKRKKARRGTVANASPESRRRHRRSNARKKHRHSHREKTKRRVVDDDDGLDDDDDEEDVSELAAIAEQ